MPTVRLHEQPLPRPQLNKLTRDLIAVAVRNLNEHQVPRNDNDNDMPRKHTKRERRRQRLMWISKQVARPQTWEGEGIFRRAMGFDGSDDTYNINDGKAELSDSLGTATVLTTTQISKKSLRLSIRGSGWTSSRRLIG